MVQAALDTAMQRHGQKNHPGESPIARPPYKMPTASWCWTTVRSWSRHPQRADGAKGGCMRARGAAVHDRGASRRASSEHRRRGYCKVSLAAAGRAKA